MRPWLGGDLYDASVYPPIGPKPVVLLVCDYGPGGVFLRARARLRDGWRTITVAP